MKLQSLQDLYSEELKNIHYAENQLLKALPKLAKAAASPDLKTAFEDHLQEGEDQISRLEEILDRLDVQAKSHKCKSIEALIEEAQRLTEEDVEEEVLDAALIMAAQKIEHYEIASYGCVRTYAEELGLDEDAELLQESLEEEKGQDERLTDLAMEHINLEAEELEEETVEKEGEEGA